MHEVVQSVQLCPYLSIYYRLHDPLSFLDKPDNQGSLLLKQLYSPILTQELVETSWQKRAPGWRAQNTRTHRHMHTQAHTHTHTDTHTLSLNSTFGGSLPN